MRPLDYNRSFLIGTAEWNEVRFQVESRTRIIDGESSDDFIQCASCKSEDTFAEKDLFYEDNYDFLPVFGKAYGLLFRRKADLNQNYRNCVPADELWSGMKHHLVEARYCDRLLINKEVREATYAYMPLVVQTEIWDDVTGLKAIIEYPAKTVNTRREDNIFQVDTGPLAFPDLTRRYEPLVDCIHLAFVAFNRWDRADFVLESPTPLPENDAVKVHHYSRRINLKANHRMFALR